MAEVERSRSAGPARRRGGTRAVKPSSPSPALVALAAAPIAIEARLARRSTAAASRQGAWSASRVIVEADIFSRRPRQDRRRDPDRRGRARPSGAKRRWPSSTTTAGAAHSPLDANAALRLHDHRLARPLRDAGATRSSKKHAAGVDSRARAGRGPQPRRRAAADSDRAERGRRGGARRRWSRAVDADDDDGGAARRC